MHMQTMSRKFHTLPILTIIALLPLVASAGELVIQPAITADYYNLSVDFSEDVDQEGVSESVYLLTPSLTGSYTSNKVQLSTRILAEETKHSEQDEQNSSFITYGVAGQADIIDNLLALNGSVNKTYRSASVQAGVFNDSVFGSDNLIGITNSAFGLNLATGNSRVLQVRSNLQFQRSKANDDIDLTEFEGQGISRYDTKSALFDLAVKSPENSTVVWDLMMQTSESDRVQASNYRASTFRGYLGIPINSSFAFTFNSTVNKNQIANEQALSDGLTYKQYGYGLQWIFTKESFLKLFNYSSKNGEQERREFIGGEFNWVLSSRTRMMLTADRNQFGEKYGFTLTQASRVLRTQITYNEGIDIESRNNFISEKIDSYLPDGLSDQQTQEDQSRDIFGQDIQLIDVVSRYKTGQVSLSYDNQRKLKLFLALNYSEKISIEDTSSFGNLNRKITGYSTSAAYAISPKTSITLNNSLSRSTFLDTEGVETGRVEDNKMWEVRLTSARSSSLNMTASISERDSNRLGQAYTDKRLQLGFKYTFN